MITSKIIKIPPPAWLLIFLAFSFFAHYAVPEAGRPLFNTPVLGAILFAGGFSLIARGALIFRKEGAEIRPDSPVNTKLVTGGPFRMTRNPMYLGMILALLGITLYVGTLPMLIAPLLQFIILNYVFIPFEEAKMERQFGEEYRAYKRKVRRWL